MNKVFAAAAVMFPLVCWPLGVVAAVRTRAGSRPSHAP
jgi:hypothetical protein